MVPTYIRFLFAYANSDQNGDGCQGVGCCCGCCGLYAGVQFQATIPTSCWPTSGSQLAADLIGCEPVMRISTSLLALGCQSGVDATLATPTRARSRSIGSRSFRMSPFLTARFTKVRRASWTCA